LNAKAFASIGQVIRLPYLDDVTAMITTNTISRKEVTLMLVVEVMLALMLFTWGAAIWASFHDEETGEHAPQGQYWRRAA
jgi:hypothetical protein